jgi:glycosyltransferase involved in cell wall biosynthesis
MFTNTYLPHVGGVARSVSSYEEEFRRRGHDVCVVAPEYDGAEDSPHVLRTPAIQKFNGSDFSVRLPQPGLIADFLDDFRPEILHSHHPFLLGDSALRAAWTRRLPLVFTHHTLYEQYTRYVPLDSEAMQRVAIQMATEYCNLCTHVVAPSQSIADLLRQRCVQTPITAIPTGIDLELFGRGDGAAFRRRFEIKPRTLVVGHVGRLAGEKNLEYLARAVGRFLAERSEAIFLVVGSGDFEDAIRDIVAEAASPEQVVLAGSHTGEDLAGAYAAMNVFAFSSQSETQGMVLAEAMAAATPVVALDGPGVREVVNDRNGRLLAGDASEAEFAAALTDLTADRTRLRALGRAAQKGIAPFGLAACADRMLELYGALIEKYAYHESDPSLWDRFLSRLEIEWNLIVEKTTALTAAVVETDATRSQLD